MVGFVARIYGLMLNPKDVSYKIKVEVDTKLELFWLDLGIFQRKRSLIETFPPFIPPKH